MKQFLVFLIASLSTFVGNAQDIVGQWNGAFEVQGMQLRIVFHIAQNENGYSATMDSPDQQVKGIPVSSTTFQDGTLILNVENIGFTYEGRLDSEAKFVGSFAQNGMEFPLDLSLEPVVTKANNRPQEPKEPFPYQTEEVKFKNKQANIHLAGTLSLPAEGENFPVVVLISGSGPQNRNEELLGHKPFLVLSDFLTRNGIAVLRFDDRGTAQSGGDFASATTYDFSTDVDAAVEFLQTRKEINKKQIGLIGHSEGGIIAPMVASRNKRISFIVLLAGTGIPGDELLLLQQQYIARSSGVSEGQIQKNTELSAQVFKRVKKTSNSDSLRRELNQFLEVWVKENDINEEDLGMSTESFIEMQIEQVTSPWMMYFIQHDPRASLKKVKCAVYALNGEKDLQVPPKENLTEIFEAAQLGGAREIKIETYPNLNHLFQECETGLPSEYASIEQTFSPDVMKDIVDWINSILAK